MMMGIFLMAESQKGLKRDLVILRVQSYPENHLQNVIQMLKKLEMTVDEFTVMSEEMDGKNARLRVEI
jgi:hypothetical protein